jgi:hypothetical protein
VLVQGKQQQHKAATILLLMAMKPISGNKKSRRDLQEQETAAEPQQKSGTIQPL